MKKLSYTRPHHAGRLYVAVAAADPLLAPTFDLASSTPTIPHASFTISSDGTTAVLYVPDAVADAVVTAAFDAHDPTPDPPVVIYQQAHTANAVVRTVGVVPVEVFRYPFSPNSGLSIELTLFGTDAVSGALRKLRVDLTGKRLAGGIVQVGATTVLVNHGDAAALAWPGPALSVVGTDLILTVVGAAGRSIDWGVSVSYDAFGPGGLV